MSTKKLSRTILEAGTSYFSKYSRNREKRQERAQVREYLTKVTIDPEFANEVINPKKPNSRKWSEDNLGAVNRYLDSWVGKSWTKCHSEIKRKFNPKSLAGYHIVNDHLLGMVFTNEIDIRKRLTYSFKHSYYYVDENNILRKGSNPYKLISREDINFGPVSSWLGNRKIEKLGGKYYWFIYPKNCQWIDYELTDVSSFHPEGFKSGFQPVEKINNRIIPATGKFRQGRLLSKFEYDTLNSFPRWLIDEINDQSPDEIRYRKNKYEEWKIEQQRREFFSIFPFYVPELKI